MSTPEQSTYELVGVSLSGPPPLGRIHVRLPAGVTALYGVNGAGKSRLLAGIHSALQGFGTRGPSQSVLHLRVHDPNAPLEHGFLGALLGAAAEELAEHREALFNPSYGRYEDVSDVGEAEAWERAALTGIVRGQTLSGLGGLLFDAALDDSGVDADNWRELRDDVCNSGYLSLAPVGEHAPRWAVWFGSVLRGPGTQLNDTYDAQRETALEMLRYQESRDRASNQRIWDLLGEGFPSGLGSLSIMADVIIPGPKRTRYTDVPRPSWVPVEVVYAGRVIASPVDVIDADISPPDLDDLTRSWLLSDVPYGEDGVPERLVIGAMDDEVELDRRFEQAAETLSERASALARTLLVDAPELRFRIGHPERWLRGDITHWEAHDWRSDSWIQLNAVSKAEIRWSTIAIRLAMTSLTPGTHGVFLQDEPEAALHRRAEQHLVTGLRSIAQELGASLIVATHSPAFLDNSGVDPAHVHRDAYGSTAIQQMSLPLRGEFEAALAALNLGLTPGDVLQLIRLFIVVEGEHDRAVLETLLSETLDTARAAVAPMRGAKNLQSVLNARLIFDYTDAPVLVVIDNIKQALIQPLWEQAVSHAAKGRTKEAVAALRPLEGVEGGEARWLREFGEQAVRSGRLDRLNVFGLGQPDILCYLDPAAFLRGSQDWPDLFSQWQAAKRTGDRRDFKQWFRARGATISVARAARAAGSLDHWPDDLLHLSLQIRILAGPTQRELGSVLPLQRSDAP